ncbi:MAG: hypothetical protein F6J98_14345, partial [Moorea sp. SIO4G2]|nr:hypothetical protein [Moorena sp. SIO4G2]
MTYGQSDRVPCRNCDNFLPYSLLPTPYSLFPLLDNTNIVSSKIPSKCHRCRQLLQFRFTQLIEETNIVYILVFRL